MPPVWSIMGFELIMFDNVLASCQFYYWLGVLIFTLFSYFTHSLRIGNNTYKESLQCFCRQENTFKQLYQYCLKNSKQKKRWVLLDVHGVKTCRPICWWGPAFRRCRFHTQRFWQADMRTPYTTLEHSTGGREKAGLGSQDNTASSR